MMRYAWAVIAAAIGLTVLIGLMLVLAGLSPLRALFVGVNVATMLAYGYDKHRSRPRGRRVPEAALHAMAAVGGTPGGFLGQVVFRHKTRDRKFHLIFWSIAAVQIVVLLTWSRWRHG
ncbi:MAG: DUF1294 domain-containing protein [Phycisphaeraceae bacterium]|nr:DUF1294 domain-containing protein [Phycisphaeraceae bacterium]